MSSLKVEHDDCVSCGEEMPKNECPKSERPCGHHCNCSWVQDGCCWCGKEFGEQAADATTTAGGAA
jgi:hypothetical protein